MAKMTFDAGADYAIRLGRLGDAAEGVIKKAVFPAAGIVADEIRKNIDNLPTDTMRLLQDGEQFTGLPQNQKIDLQRALGITGMRVDDNGFIGVRVGFGGYGTMKTRKYRKGVPNAMLARSVESGSSVRRKTPFVRPAINAKKKQAVEEMRKIIDSEIEKIMK